MDVRMLTRTRRTGAHAVVEEPSLPVVHDEARCMEPYGEEIASRIVLVADVGDGPSELGATRRSMGAMGFSATRFPHLS